MRVPRTFVFVDLSGFTNYTAAFGDDAAGRVLSTFRGIVRTVASERGVRIAKWLGDGCMVVAVDQRDAIEFVLDLEQQATDVCAPLTIRAGLATGHALLFEGDDYIGSAVNMAARLCDRAKGVEVLIPTMQLERLPEGVHAEPVRRDRTPRISRSDRRRPTRRHADACQRRHVRSLDAQSVHLTDPKPIPMSFKRGAALTTASTLGFAENSDIGSTAGNGFFRRWPDDLAALQEAGITDVRLTLDWARLQPRPAGLDDDWAERYEQMLDAASAIDLRVWATLHDGSIPRWFDNDGGFDDDETFTTWWPRWVERIADRFGDHVAGWVPFAEIPLGAPTQPWRDTWSILEGTSPVVASVSAETTSIEEYVGRAIVPRSRAPDPVAARRRRRRPSSWKLPRRSGDRRFAMEPTTSTVRS